MSEPDPIDTEEPADGRAVAGALLRAFFRLAGHWRLGKREQGVLLGGVSRETLGRWERAVPSGGGIALERDQTDRLACLLAIHKALRTIYPSDQIAYGWVRRPHEDLAGRTPLEVMLGGGIVDLITIRAYLDDEAGDAMPPRSLLALLATLEPIEDEFSVIGDPPLQKPWC